MQPGDHRPRRRGGIFDCLNQQQACLNHHSERRLKGYESSLEGSSYGGNYNVVLDGIPDGWDPQGASSVASSLFLVPLVSPGHSDCQSSYFIFTLFTLLTSLLIKYPHSHPPYSLRNLCSLAALIHSAQHHHAHPLLTFFFPFMNSRIPQRQEANS